MATLESNRASNIVEMEKSDIPNDNDLGLQTPKL
jgi:hypothetical protein